mmetsp:Transcript_17516/g.42748  ORF Transcript_17516/g.42748 Transcript_17516/m.42748 type:complete len:457 (-) Transcript_17516:478-1848(-)
MQRSASARHVPWRLGKLPPTLGHQCSLRPDLLGVARARVALQRPLVHPLEDGSDPEEGKRRVEVPVLDPLWPVRAPAVGGHVLLLSGDAWWKVDAMEARDLELWRQVVWEAVVRKVRDRVSDGRKLPVEHRLDPHRCVIIDDVVDPEVPVHDRRLGVWGEVIVEPHDELVHLRDLSRLGCLVLLGPCPYLPPVEALALPELPQPDLRRLVRVHPCEHVVHGIVRGRPFCGLAARHLRVCVDRPRHVVHNIERRPKHRVILAQHVRLRHRKPSAPQRPDDLELPLNSVRASQDLARRFLAQNKLPLAVERHVIRWVALAVPKLPHACDLASEAIPPPHAAQVLLERRLIKLEGRTDCLGAWHEFLKRELEEFLKLFDGRDCLLDLDRIDAQGLGRFEVTPDVVQEDGALGGLVELQSSEHISIRLRIRLAHTSAARLMNHVKELQHLLVAEGQEGLP